MVDIGSALLHFYPACKWIVRGDKLIWEDTNTPRPTDEELLQKVEQLKAERPLKDLRAERDRRLPAVDWVTSRATSTETPVPQEWKTYMQALRDLPATTEDPTNPVWPPVPE